MEQIQPVHLLIALGLLAGLWFFLRLRRRGREEPDYLKQVRALVERREFRRAGELQLRHGNVQEAYNLFDRGNVHDRASLCAEQIGLVDKAAAHAERAGELQRAAELYDRIGDYPSAARLLQRTGRFRAAAETLEKHPGADPAQLATLWENAFLDAVPKEGDPIAARDAEALRHAAERAAATYKQAGDLERSAHFYELSGDDERARVIRQTLPARTLSPLDQARDRLKDRLKTALSGPPAPPPSGPFASAAGTDGSPPATPASGAARPDPLSDFSVRPHSSAQQLAVPEPATASLPEVALRPEPSLPVEPTRALPVEAATRGRAGERALTGEGPTAPDSSALRALLDPLELTPGTTLDALDPDFGFTLAAPSPEATPQPGQTRAGGMDRGFIGAVVEEVLHRQKEAGAASGRALANDVLHQIVQQGAGGPGTPAQGSAVVHAFPSSTSAPTSVARLEVIHVHTPGSERLTPIRRESDRYVLGDCLGEGGMGVVYRARDNVLEREVALKLLPYGTTTSAAALKSFQQEAKSLAQLNHPNIVTIHDFGVLDGHPFICMELVHGETVADMLREASATGLAVLDVLEVAEGLLSALAYAHKRGLVHRDIKPANVMRTADGVVKLMDFGIAKLVEPEKTTRITGTPAYMAPEQMTGRGVDQRSDLFALGVTLYEMLTGRLPFTGLRRDTPVRSTTELAPATPKRLDQLVTSCLAIDPERRPSSAEGLLKLVRAMRRQVETYLERESGQFDAVTSRHAVSAIETETLKALLSQISRPHGEEAPRRQLSGIFRAALADKRPDVRAAAVEAFPAASPEALRQTLAGALEDPDEAVRIVALRRMGHSDDPLLVDLLAQRSRASDTLGPGERQALFESLAEVGRERAVPVLAEVFRRVRRGRRGTTSKEVRALIGAAARIDSPTAAALVKDLRSFQGELGESSVLATVAEEAPVEAPEEAAERALPSEVEEMLLDYLLQDAEGSGKS